MRSVSVDVSLPVIASASWLVLVFATSSLTCTFYHLDVLLHYSLSPPKSGYE